MRTTDLSYGEMEVVDIVGYELKRSTLHSPTAKQVNG